MPAASRRRHRRLTLRVIVEITSARGLSREVATTLGAGGLFVNSDSPLPKDTSVKLRFQLPGRDAVHEVEGRVAWVATAHHGGLHTPGMGIAFEDRRASAELARELEAYSDAFA